MRRRPSLVSLALRPMIEHKIRRMYSFSLKSMSAVLVTAFSSRLSHSFETNFYSDSCQFSNIVVAIFPFFVTRRDGHIANMTNIANMDLCRSPIRYYDAHCQFQAKPSLLHSLFSRRPLIHIVACHVKINGETDQLTNQNKE